MTATLTISMEVELAWGTHDLPGGIDETLSANREAETRGLRRLLETCDRFEIPISFDVVGHLVHESCSGVHRSPHEPGWFDADPGTDVDTDPLFYAPDLVDAIVTADSDHEICTHTYSHALCDEIDREVLAWELERVRDVHQESGLAAPRSFVAPRHRPVENAALNEQDIDAVRRPFPSFEPYDWSGVRAFFEQYVPSHPLRDSRVVDEVLETYCKPSPTLTAPFLQNGQRPPLREHATIPKSVRQRLHRYHLKRALEVAIGDDRELHLWTHLYNLSNDSQWPPVRDFLATVAKRRAAGDVAIQTMAELADARL